ncbi:MAG: ATP-binding protein [Pseudomonadota bacterium]
MYNQETQSNEYTNCSVGAVLGYDANGVKAFGSSLMASLCHPADLPSVLQHFQKISCLGDGDVASVEYRMRHKSDGWIWFLSTDAVLDRHLDGSVHRHIGVATDITAQKLAEEQVRESSEAAAIANEDLRAFAYSISHDMKSPLNTLHLILSEIDHDCGKDLNADARRLFDHACRTVSDMRSRLVSVLDYTRLIEGEAQMAHVPLGEVVAQVLSEMKAEFDACGATVRVGELPTVFGVAQDLHVCFQHLCANALKFRSRDHTLNIEISDTSPKTASGLVQISVKDNGIGIPFESHEIIFDMFKRLNSERDFPGVGLGLAICRRIAITHGGAITVASQKGEGACFTVQLKTANEDHGADG